MSAQSNAAAAPEEGAVRLTTSEARDGFSDLVNRVAYARERVVIHRRGRELVAVVPIEDLRALDALEDRLDAEDAQAALAEHLASGEPGVPWEQVKGELKL